MSGNPWRERILKGSVLGTLLWLAWPVVIGNLVNVSYNLIDAVWLGRLGKAAFGAPTVVWPLIMFLYSVGMGYAMAGLSLISQYYGDGDYEMARRSIGQLLGFTLLMASGLSVAGFLTASYLLRLMGVPPDIYPLALGYARIIFAGIPFAFAFFAFNMASSAIGDTVTPMKIQVVTAVVNIGLDPILIFGLLGAPRLEVRGAALATIFSRMIASAIGLYFLFSGFHGISLRLRDLRIEGWWLRKVFSIGTPLAIQRSSTSLGFTVMMSIVSRFGSTVVAAYGVAVRIVDIIQSFTWGLMRATSIMVGQNIGAQQYDRSWEITRKSMALTAGVLGLGAALIFAGRAPLVALFVNEPDVLREGSRMLSIFVWSIPFFGLFFIGGAVANGSGHTKTYAAISVIRLWVLRIGLSIILAYNLGLGPLGIYLGMALSNIGAGLLALLWTIRKTWLKRVID